MTRKFSVFNKHVLGNSRDYTKFIILSNSRTGSTLLNSLLMSHTNVVCFSELFHPDISSFFGYKGYPINDKNFFKYIKEYSVDFLNDFIFSTYISNVKAVGFRIHYYQAQNKKQKNIWNFLKNDSKLKIIHLKRRNFLDCLISRELVKISNIRHVRCKEFNFKVDKKLKLSYKKCCSVFLNSKKEEKKFDYFFKKNDVCNIYYEHLVDNTELEIKRVLKFLEVNNQKLKSNLCKVVKQSKNEVIDDYNQLRKKFQNTEWEDFFN